ncbi:MAG: Ig-like domain-containing protein [bacterium]|nr:Ig-like domain-containing protein [bacterium]
MGENYVWSFTTGSATDIVAPTVILTVPVNHAVGVLIGTNLSATFSEAMNPLTITTSNFVLRLGTSVVAGSVFIRGDCTLQSGSKFVCKQRVYSDHYGQCSRPRGQCHGT